MQVIDTSSRVVHLATEQTQIGEPEVAGWAADPSALSAHVGIDILSTSASFPLLLALDDDSVARAAVRVTAAAARVCGAAPTVLRVFELAMYCTPESLPALTNAEEIILAAGHNHEYRDELLGRVTTLAGHPVDWCTELDVGDDVRCIIRRAEAIGAELIVMGLEHHGTIRRTLMGDTVRGVMSSGIAPVLAVTRSLEALPKHAVVGMDFTPSSIHAARWARKLLDRDGSLDLVYIEPVAIATVPRGSDPVAEDVASGAVEMEKVFDTCIENSFAALIWELAPLPTMRVAAVRRTGRAADQLCAYAQEVGADLIALGSHRYTLLERLRLGSVSAAVVHDARCSVLVAPPEAM